MRPEPAPRFFIRTYGCQMNVYDSGRIADLLGGQGWRAADSPEDADLVILNTCHIREKAAEKVYSELGRLALLRAPRSRRPWLAVAGCVAQAEGREIMRRAPQVDLVIGPQAYHRLPELLDGLRNGAARAGRVALDFPPESKFDRLPEEMMPRGASAYLTVQEGCDRLCTFCVVPYTRGAEFSRPPEEVVAEARRLLDGGAVELVLLGQNVNAYDARDGRGESWDLARLLAAIHELPSCRRLRYTTSHPLALSDSLIAAHRDLPKLAPFLHLPVQSGADSVLAAMNRRHTARQYRERIEKLRAARSDIALSSDFIVGFPGETDDNFADTLRLVRDIDFAHAYAFKFSARPGTPAAEMPNQVPEEKKAERLAELQGLLAEQQLAFNQKSVGGVQEILLVGRGRHEGQLKGRGPWMQSVVIDGGVDGDGDGDGDGDDNLGRIVRARIQSAGPHGLHASLETGFDAR